jgi:hypothetical protein
VTEVAALKGDTLMETTHTFRAVLIQEADGRWSAQCLEYDIAVQAKNLTDVRAELEKALVGHFVVCTELKLKPFETLGPAPQRYWEMFKASKEALVGERNTYRIVGQGVPPIQPELRVAELQEA